MEIYERIKYIREKQNMSQDELAEKVGYKHKSAISKVERGIRDISQTMIIKYAKALGTTPSYLMGWTEEEKIPSAAEPKLNEGEEALLNLFRLIPEDKKKMVLEMIRAALGTKG